MARASHEYDWPANALLVLQERYLAGDSMAQIAKAVSDATQRDVTRNMISGIVYRRGMQREGSNYTRPQREVISKPKREKRNSEAKTRLRTPKAPPVRPPGRNSRTLVALDNGCKFPVGFDTGADQLFCGEPKSLTQPYCPRCTKRAHPRVRSAPVYVPQLCA